MRQLFTNPWTIRAFSTAIPSALIALIEYIITGGVSGWAPLVAAFIGVFASVPVLWLMDRRKPLEAPTPDNLPAPPIEGKDFSPRTPPNLSLQLKV